MIFKALPVNVGDCFLLENEGTRILVDGGVDEYEVVELLNKENIPGQHIDVLICTHYDSDHINGILGILKSKEFTFKELWLPEIIGSIGYSISKNIIEVIEKIRNIDEINSEEFKPIELPVNTDCDSYDVEQIRYNLLNEINEQFFKYNRFRWTLWEEHQRILISNLKNISTLLAKSYYSGSHIRWFKFQNNLFNTPINFDLYAKNCKQVGLSQYNPDQLLYALLKISLTKINKESLVFQYDKSKFPNVLFTADSDLSFCSNQKIALTENSIVTAPHHGSSSNDKAYGYISKNNIIFVRSDRSQTKRPGLGYLSQQNRYCTVCRSRTQKAKVELVYNGISFTPNNKSCCC